MSIATAKRRRKQAANGFKHLAKLGRPIYKKKSKEKAANQLMKVIQKERLIKLRKGQSKK